MTDIEFDVIFNPPKQKDTKWIVSKTCAGDLRFGSPFR